ncbi:unnamed protein product [Arctia plantaginis]|uniref:Sequestosome-1 n=1 Tax=Arctia plantaginis TaxID=874455 RepID=A0A8S1A294_ARCPL|nr:unnamed protein product [Arctia plantaginis]
MENVKEIPIKVYTFWNEKDKPEVRRFGVVKSSVDSFFLLSQRLLEVYPGLKDKNYIVSWKDNDGDDVVISSDMELKTALQFTNYNDLKLYIYCKGEVKKPESNIFIGATNIPGCPAQMPTVIPGNIHLGVICDSCDNTIVGFRYKCTVCDDFDLCSQCEAAGCHPEHCMVRVPTATMPRTLIKAAIKRSRQFLKSVSSNVGEECAYMKRRRDRSGERKHRGHHGGHHGPHGGHHGPHGGHHGPPGGDHHRRPRSSWLETFATYMNEFANLAGDIDLSDDKAKVPQTKPEEQQPQGTQEQVKKAANETVETPKQPEPTTSANVETEIPVIPPVLNVENIKGLLQMFLQDMHSSVIQKENDVEMGQGDRKTPEADNVTVNSGTSMKSARSGSKSGSVVSEATADSSINTDFYKEASPEKADDWTMINKEKDLMDVGTTTQTEDIPPIGFNLPEEFQERVRINEGASLYPPLYSSAAVLNPKVPEVTPGAPPSAPVAEGATAAPAQPAPAPAPQPQQTSPQSRPQPRQRHPKPHIDAAIEQMMKMGFTNDGDWLTQLLEHTDGNIASVLDLLTPVNPKK